MLSDSSTFVAPFWSSNSWTWLGLGDCRISAGYFKAFHANSSWDRFSIHFYRHAFNYKPVFLMQENLACATLPRPIVCVCGVFFLFFFKVSYACPWYLNTRPKLHPINLDKNLWKCSSWRSQYGILDINRSWNKLPVWESSWNLVVIGFFAAGSYELSAMY